MKKKYIFIILTVLLIIFPILFLKQIDLQEEREENFSVRKSYLEVIKNILNKKSLEEILEKNNAVLIEKKWEYLNVDTQFILRPRTWEVNGKMHFKIKKIDKDLGSIELKFQQTIEYNRNRLDIKVVLEEEKKYLKNYENIIEITPNGNETKIKVKNLIKINILMLSFLKNYLNQKLNNFIEEDIKKIKNNIKKQVEKQNSLISIPIK